MKIIKKIICCFIVLLTLGTIISVDASTEIYENPSRRMSLKMTNQIEEKGDKKQSYLEPIYDDFEAESDIPITYTADATEYSYENNDLFSAAKCLSPTFSGTSIARNYNVSIEASLHRNEWLWGIMETRS